jgi:tripartite-type tricarboxylate transporter receptor subunit TctC
MMRFLRSATVLMIAASMVCGQASVAPAQYPERPIRIILPFLAGSSSDNVVRMLGAKLTERLRQPVIVENRVGGSTIIGTDAVVRAAPDGYTIGFSNSSSHAISALMSAKPLFDPIKDIAPIGIIGSSPLMIVASGKVPVTNMQELIALAKSKPGGLSYASAGTATLPHLGGELFNKVAGVEITHVPYRGTSQSIFDLLEGRIELLIGTIPAAVPHIKEGKLRGIAIMSDKRVASLPDVPTVAEAGVPGTEAELWSVMIMPVGVKPEIAGRLSQELLAILQLPDVQETLRVQGIDPEPGSAEAAAARIKADVAKWAEVIKAADIKPN